MVNQIHHFVGYPVVQYMVGRDICSWFMKYKVNILCRMRCQILCRISVVRGVKLL